MARAALDVVHNALDRAIATRHPHTERLHSLESLTDCRVVIAVACFLDLRDRIALACTSRRIRTVLTSERQLWTSVWYNLRSDGRGTQLLESILQLASPLPVRLGLSAHALTFRRIPGLGGLLEQYIARVAQLEMVLRSFRREPGGARCTDVLGAAWGDIFGVLQHPAPCLHSLRLTTSLMHISDPRDRLFVQYLPDDDLFSGQHPSLRRLHLRLVQLRLEPGTSYPLLHHLVSLTYTASGVDLTEDQLDLLLEQAPQLIYLGLSLHGYVTPTTTSAVPGRTRKVYPITAPPSQVKLGGFALGGREILSRFANATALIAYFQLPIQSSHLDHWAGASIKLVVLGYSNELSDTLYKLPQPHGDSQQLVVFIGINRSLDAFSSSHLISELSLSESQWEWIMNEENPQFSLPNLNTLCVVLSTCIDAHKHAGVLWQRCNPKQRCDRSVDSHFPALREVCIVAVNDTTAFRYLDSCRHIANANLLPMSGALSPCPYFGTCRLSLHDLSEFLLYLLAGNQRLELLRLIGVTDIVDVDLDVAWSSVLELTSRFDFDPPEAMPLEQSGRFEFGHWMSEAYPASDGSDTLLSDYQLRLD